MIRILTDTASDITAAEAAAKQIDLVEVGVHFGGVPYDQMHDDGFEAFYHLLDREKEMPTTSQPSPSAFVPLFRAAADAGDPVVAILLSGGLSGTVQSALLAREMVEEGDIHVIDSRNAIIGQRLLVDYAVKLRDEGRSAAEIAETVAEAASRVTLFGALDTLKFLRKGGRIPKSTELVGSALGIKPLIAVKGGVIEMAGKARGQAGSVTLMLKRMEEHADFDPAMPMYFGYSLVDTACRHYRRLAVQKFHLRDVTTWPVGPIVGAHIGPGAFAAAWLAATPFTAI